MISRIPALLALSAGSVLVVGAHGAPTPPPGKEQLLKSSPTSSGPTVMDRSSGFTENFDSYTVGSGIVGQNGWQLWAPEYFDGIVTDTTAASPPNSLEAMFHTDLVQLFDITSGKWEVKVQTFAPTGMSGNGYFIMLNTFELPFDPTTARWSLQIEFNPDVQPPHVQSQWGFETTPLIFDQWVELRAEIDLDAQPEGLLNVWYNGQQFVFDRHWNGNTSGPAGGAVRIQCIDLFSTAFPGAAGNFKWDSISLMPMDLCYANCDGSSEPPILTVDDFTCFINEFAAASGLPHEQQVVHYANCDGSTTMPALTVDDFTCFINEFAGGCP